MSNNLYCNYLDRIDQGMELLCPASYLQNSNWMFEETKGSKWTLEENKQFETALALFDKDTPDRWCNVAAMIPGKTVNDVIKQYKELEEDVSDIEAGLIPIPGYLSSSFNLEWVNHQGFDGLKQIYGPGGKRSSSTRTADQERKKGVPWTEEEHRQFLMGLQKYGKGDWRSISHDFVTTRTPTQVASHAQKYFIRQLSGGKDKRRSSIHDITTINLSNSKVPSPDHNKPPSANNSNMVVQPQDSNMNGMAKAKYDWNLTSQGPPVALNLPNSILMIAPPHGTSPNELKLQVQNLHEGTLHGPWFGPHNPNLQLQSRQLR
ncbi:unnamed protein product [Ilex paraguariensis]|uniref:Uncharacterized protein n=1 Tax=Ilex paraguariensis TaxID=185542 RepID=A0ABC8QMQ2_9AQUA